MSGVLQTYILPVFVANVVCRAHAVAVWETTSGPRGSVVAGKGSGSSVLIFWPSCRRTSLYCASLYKLHKCYVFYKWKARPTTGTKTMTHFPRDSAVWNGAAVSLEPACAL